MNDIWDIFEDELGEDVYIPQHKLPKEELLRKCRRCGGVQIPCIAGLGQPGDGNFKYRLCQDADCVLGRILITGLHE